MWFSTAIHPLVDRIVLNEKLLLTLGVRLKCSGRLLILELCIMKWEDMNKPSKCFNHAYKSKQNQ